MSLRGNSCQLYFSSYDFLVLLWKIKKSTKISRCRNAQKKCLLIKNYHVSAHVAVKKIQIFTVLLNMMNQKEKIEINGPIF